MLRSVEFVSAYQHHGFPWLIETITALLDPTSNPHLVDITFRYVPEMGPGRDEEGLIPAIDRACGAPRASPDSLAAADPGR